MAAVEQGEVGKELSPAREQFSPAMEGFSPAREEPSPAIEELSPAREGWVPPCQDDAVALASDNPQSIVLR